MVMRRILPSFTFAFVLATASTAARADFASATCSTSRGSPVDVMTSIHEPACLGHVDHHPNGTFKRIVTLPEPMSGVVRANRDMSVVVYIATYLPLLKEEALAQNPVVVRVVRDGRLVKEQRLRELVKTTEITESISHVDFADRLGDSVVDDQLEIVMNGGRRVVLDVK